VDVDVGMCVDVCVAWDVGLVMVVADMDLMMEVCMGVGVEMDVCINVWIRVGIDVGLDVGVVVERGVALDMAPPPA